MPEPQELSPQSMAYAALDDLSDPLYVRWHALALTCRVSAQTLAVDVIHENWSDVYRYIEKSGRIRIAKTILADTLLRTTGRHN